MKNEWQTQGLLMVCGSGIFIALLVFLYNVLPQRESGGNSPTPIRMERSKGFPLRIKGHIRPGPGSGNFFFGDRVYLELNMREKSRIDNYSIYLDDPVSGLRRRVAQGTVLHPGVEACAEPNIEDGRRDSSIILCVQCFVPGMFSICPVPPLVVGFDEHIPGMKIHLETQTQPFVYRHAVMAADKEILKMEQLTVSASYRLSPKMVSVSLFLAGFVGLLLCIRRNATTRGEARKSIKELMIDIVAYRRIEAQPSEQFLITAREVGALSARDITSLEDRGYGASINDAEYVSLYDRIYRRLCVLFAD